MQQLQTTVLNKIQPGRTPVFIIAPKVHDGDALAHLLSHHLEMTGDAAHRQDKTNTISNYFSNYETQRLFHAIAKNKFDVTDLERDNLRYIFSKNADNGILWGMQCSYELFFGLRMHDISPDSIYIFLYGTDSQEVKAGNTLESLLSGARAFCQLHAGRSVFLPVSAGALLPNTVLSLFPHSQKELATLPGKWQAEMTATATPGPIQALNHQLDGENILLKNGRWYRGPEVLAFFIVQAPGFAEHLIRKISLLYLSFTTPPVIYVITRSETDRNTISTLCQQKLPRILIKLIVCEGPLAPRINTLLKSHPSEQVLIDNLSLDYAVEDLLAPFRTATPPRFNFGNLVANKIISIQSGSISLADILTTRTLFDNITFAYNTWQQLQGFDESLDDSVIAWDLGIRSLALADSYALESTAHLADIQQSGLTYTIPESAYDAVVAKHKNIYGNHLTAVIQLVSENQLVPQAEIRNLNYKISSLDQLLQHSRDNLKTLDEFNAALKKQIASIENNKLYRLSQKLRHYKNIFFKEKAGGSSGALKKILKFFVFALSKAGFRVVRKVMKKAFKKLYIWAEDQPVRIVYIDAGKPEHDGYASYHEWIKAKLDQDTLKEEYNKEQSKLVSRPKISILMPVYNPPVHFLKEAIESVMGQLYDNWELCIADDCSPNPQVQRLLNSYTARDSRIKAAFRKENGHISAASNSALELATGDFVVLLDHDDLLTANCLSEIVKHINAHPEDEFIYSDEDKINEQNIFTDPFFKPNWSPDRFMSVNYVSHVAAISKKLIDKIGGFRLGFEGSQDYDLFLRISEATQHIGHIPKILYHWRIHQASVASEEINAKPYAYIAAKKALEEALERRGLPGEVQYLPLRGNYRINYEVVAPGKVSIIIPTKDQARLMQTTIDSIISLTDYPDYEILVLNNNSNTPEFFELMKKYEQAHPGLFRCVDATFPFNFSRLMNFGASLTTGEYILMLNNDVEILHSNWITKMVSYAQQQRIGAVGVKLLYPDDNIQHAGTVIGLGGVAGHVLVGLYKDNPGYFYCLQTTINYSAVTAACLMVRRDVFEEVEGMDEYLEVEYNDVDFCLKVMDKGYYNVYIPDVVLYHYESATRGHPSQNSVSHQRHLREVKYFKEKWLEYVKDDPFYNPNLTRATQDFRVDFSK